MKGAIIGGLLGIVILGGIFTATTSNEVKATEDFLRTATVDVCADDARNSSRCDYVADGIADHVEIQSAIDSLPPAGGKVVLTEGTFNVASTVNLRSDMTLQGMGIDATVIRLANLSNVDVIAGTTKDHITLKDFFIDGNRSNQTAPVHGVTWLSVSNGLMSNVKTKNLSGNGIRIGAGSTLVTVSDCIAVHNSWRGVHTAGATNTTITGCFTKNNGLDGIDIDGFSQDVIVTSNNSRNNGRAGIFVEDGSRDVVVSDNLCSFNQGNGINVNQQLTNGATERVTITGNVCRRNDGHGIRVRANVPTSTVSDIVITGNILLNNGQGSQLTRGITVGQAGGATTTNIQIVGNRTGNTQEWETQMYGIEVQPGPTNVMVNDNNVVGNILGGIYNRAGADTMIEDNMGDMPNPINPS